VGLENRKQSVYGLLLQNLNSETMLAVLHSDINSLKSGLLHLTGHPYFKNSRSAKVKDGIKNLVLRNYLIDRYSLALVPKFVVRNS
jgi:hypothetical protein